MSKKGLSVEEKKARMLQIFYEKKECFQLKELERIASKEKGIVSNTVKDILDKLVDDGLIESDKIGSTIYFWSFPSKAINSRKRKLEDLKTNLSESTKKLKYLEATISETKKTEDEQVTVNKVLEAIADMEIELGELNKKLQVCKENDPNLVNEMEAKTKALKDAANRWTDNVFAVKSWCKKKFLVEDNVVNKQLGIPEDFDYVE